jgi:hypothetical protein
MSEPDPKPAAMKPAELYQLTDSAIRAAERCIRIRQFDEAIRLLELATANLKRLKAAA